MPYFNYRDSTWQIFTSIVEMVYVLTLFVLVASGLADQFLHIVFKSVVVKLIQS